MQTNSHFGQDLAAQHVAVVRQTQVIDCLPILVIGTSRPTDANMAVTSCGLACTGVLPLPLCSVPHLEEIMEDIAKRAAKSCNLEFISSDRQWLKPKTFSNLMILLSGGNLRFLALLLGFAAGPRLDSYTAGELCSPFNLPHVFTKQVLTFKESGVLPQRHSLAVSLMTCRLASCFEPHCLIALLLCRISLQCVDEK